MKQTLVTLTIARSPRSDITPLLLAYLPEEQIMHVSLLEGLSSGQIVEHYAAEKGEKALVVHFHDDATMALSVSKIEQGLQQLIWQLEERGAENILLLVPGQFTSLQAQNALLLEPERLVPPLVKAIVDGHQVGIMISADDPLHQQANKWRNLSKPACFAVASPDYHDNDKLLDAGLLLQEQGADVVVLDSPGYHQRHRDLLQKLLGIPVLLSNVLLAKLAAELLIQA